MSEPRPTPTRRLPTAGKPVPGSTYRLQLGHGPDARRRRAARAVPRVARASTHVYLSPVLRAAPGSTHGYDVVDHDEIAPRARRPPALRAAARRRRTGGPRARARHRAEPHGRPDARLAQPRAVVGAGRGPDSPCADWFDVDWSAGDGAVLMPVLGERIGAVLGAGARPRRGRDPGRGHEDRPALLRPRVPGPAGDRAAAPGGAGGAPALPARVLAGRRRGAQLPPVLRRRHPRSRSASRTRRCSTPRTRWSCRSSPTARSTACASTTRTAWPTRRGYLARLREAQRRRVGRGREDPRRRRGAARRLGRPPAPPATRRCGGSSSPSSTRAAPPGSAP